MTDAPKSPPEPMATATAGEAATDGAAPPAKRGLKTAAFILVVGGVLVVFGVLGSQDGAPPMPSQHEAVGKQHQLRLNLKGELIGLEHEPPVDATVATQPGFALDKKKAEKRVNGLCMECHATLPPHHPPKQECIKCHRQQAASRP